MLGEYIIYAANIDKHPYGSLIETSLGTGIVCDTGGSFYEEYSGDYFVRELDIATYGNKINPISVRYRIFLYLKIFYRFYLYLNKYNKKKVFY